MNQQKTNNSLINWELVSVNPNNKNWNWKDLFCFWGICFQSIIGFSLIVSLYVGYNLNTLIVFFGSVLGVIFVYFFSNLIGTPSQRHGLPFGVMLRTSYGFKGAKYFALIRGFVGIFMFGIQTYFLSKAFSYLIRISFFNIDQNILEKDILLTFLLGLNLIDWSAFIFSILLQTFLFSRGFNFNRLFIRFSATLVYSGMLVFFLIILLSDVKLTFESFINIFNYENFFDKDNLIPIISVAGTIFAYFSLLLISFGDFTRYVKNERELKKGNLSLILNLIIFSFFAVFIAVGADSFMSKDPGGINKILTNPTDIIGKFNNLMITVTVLIIIIFASASTNLIANFIPSQYSLLNFLPDRLNIKSSSYIISFFGFLIGIFWLTLLSQFGILSIIDTLGSFFGPMFGIMIVDYYLVKKKQINNKDIYSIEKESNYYYSGGWHIKAIYCTILGFIFASSTIWNINFMFLQSYSWIIGLIVSSFSYYILIRD